MRRSVRVSWREQQRQANRLALAAAVVFAVALPALVGLDALTRAAPARKAQPAEADTSVVVYRTQTGKRYHRDRCSYLLSRIETTLDAARRAGLRPCSRCAPPTESQKP